MHLYLGNDFKAKLASETRNKWLVFIRLKEDQPINIFSEYFNGDYLHDPLFTIYLEISSHKLRQPCFALKHGPNTRMPLSSQHS